MPFVVCSSSGGPYDDDAFVAGYHLGQLDERLRHGLVVDEIVTLRSDSLPQFDLIAMRHGLFYSAVAEADGWATVVVKKG